MSTIRGEPQRSSLCRFHASSGGTVGSPRVHAILARRGISLGLKRVERVMRGADLQGAFLRNGRRGTSAY
ncbi:IS3 family transposase [Nocardia araoensis]|uniref:IS3 family transposase n=1 Tax=Nocardia araoensis TaxID=228600 RepID=UPI003570C92D